MSRRILWILGTVALLVFGVLLLTRRRHSESASGLESESWPPQRRAAAKLLPQDKSSEKAPPPAPTAVTPRKFSGVFKEIRTLDQWLSAVKKQIGGYPAGTPENGKYGRTLANLLAEDPANIAKAYEAILKDAELPFEGRCLTVEAIAAAAPPTQAHALLKSLLENPQLGEDVKIAVFGALTWPEVPAGPETTDYLLGLLKQSDKTGILAAEALGTLVQQLSTVDPARGNDLIDKVYLNYEEHRRNGDARGMRSALEAMGRSRNTRVEPVLRQSLQDPDGAVRSSGIRALSRFDPPDRFATAASLYISDSDSGVRIAAVAAMLPVPGATPIQQSMYVGKIPPEARSTLVNGLMNDKDADVRGSILKFWSACYQDIGSRAPEDVYQAVSTMAASDGSASLRARAKDTLRQTAGFRR